MKGLGFLFLLLLIGTTAVIYIGNGCSNKRSTTLPGVVSLGGIETKILTQKSRKLKEYNMEDDDDIPVHLEDYRPIDPVPSSKAYIKHGPIYHSTPLIPFIPGAPPPPTQPYIPRPMVSPTQPRHGGIP